MSGRLVILSGPSCAGKSPLVKGLRRFHPELCEGLEGLVLFNSRAPRPGEVDGVAYHFRSREEIEQLGEQDRYVALDVRGDLQALDLEELGRVLERADAFFEGNAYVGRLLQTHPKLADVERLSMFLAPLSREELLYLREEAGAALPKLVQDVMRRKLLRRTKRQKTNLSIKDLEEIERRCGACYTELREAHHFSHVIPCHDGEDCENWDAFYYLLGDARRAMLAVAALLRGETPTRVETWEPDLLPA